MELLNLILGSTGLAMSVPAASQAEPTTTSGGSPQTPENCGGSTVGKGTPISPLSAPPPPSLTLSQPALLLVTGQAAAMALQPKPSYKAPGKGSHCPGWVHQEGQTNQPGQRGGLCDNSVVPREVRWV